MDVFGKSDPFYVISRRTTEGGGYVRVYTSEYHKNVAHVKFMKHRVSFIVRPFYFDIDFFFWRNGNEYRLTIDPLD